MPKAIKRRGQRRRPKLKFSKPRKMKPRKQWRKLKKSQRINSKVL
jgi:hypothetical protein